MVDLVELNPSVPEFDCLDVDDVVSFLPMEQVWPDALGLGEARKGDVENGYTRFSEGDLLLPKISPTFSHGRSAIAKGLLGGVGAGTTELHVLRPRPGVSVRWLYYLTKSARFMQEGEGTLYGVAGQKRISTKWLHDFEVHAFSYSEQLMIAKWLDRECTRIDRLSSELKHQHTLLDERDRVAIKRLVTGLDESGSRLNLGPWWLGSTPTSWTPQKISRNFLTGSGTTPKSGDPRYYGGLHYWLTTSECRDGLVVESAKTVTDEALDEYSSLRFYPSGSLVVAMYGATIGKLAILGAPMTVNQACAVLYRPIELDTHFVYWWLWAHRAELMAMGEGGGQPNVSQDVIRQLVVPAPSLETQQLIVQKIEELRAWSQRMRLLSEQQSTLLTEHRTAVITAAVTGQMEVA